MSATPVNELSAFDAARLLQRRELSAEAYADACLARMMPASR